MAAAPMILPRRLRGADAPSRKIAVGLIGMGRQAMYANLPAFLCKHDLAEGRLVDVLPGWHTPDMSFFAVFADPKGVPARVRSLIDFLVESLRPTLSWDVAVAQDATQRSFN